MKRYIHILIFFVIGPLLYGQGADLLKTADFDHLSINDQWIYVKYENGAIDKSKFPGFTTLSSNKAKDLNIFKVRVPKGKNPIDYCNELRRTSSLLIYADPIINYVPLSTPSDALLSNQFYLDNIRAFDAWDITKGDDDITIGIIDTGIDLDHEDIISNLWVNSDDPVDGIDNDDNGYIDDYWGYDFADVDTDPSIQNGNHGMIVAGIAGASTNNGTGIAGVGYNTKVAALKGFKSSNGQSGGLYEAIVYAADNGLEVVNLSWGRMGSPLQSEQDIIDYAVLDQDMVVVAAGGNEGGKSTQENKWYPASYNHVLAVGASDASDNKSSGSTFNHAIDLIAPGVSMYSTVNGNSYSNGGPGTSFASPQVAATAALVKDQFPSLTAVQIMERIRVTTDDIYDVGSNSIYDGKLGKGRLNMLRAVSESNVKSLRAENPVLTSSFGEYIFFGDTVHVTATITNHLAAINSPLITISSPDNDFTITNGNFEPGFLSSLETKDISFAVVLDENLEPESDIGIRLDFSASGYEDFQYFDVTTSPDYVDFGNDNLHMTISGNGNLGLDEYVPFTGSGFNYLSDTLMTYSGLVLATNAADVSDNIISDFTSLSRDQDFAVEQFYKLYHHPGADHFGYSEFIDLNKSLRIEQSNIAYDGEDYLIIRYRIVNTSASPITNLSLGVFCDWDLDDETTNYAEYDVSDNYIFSRNNSNDLYAGVQITGGDNFEYSALDLEALNGNTADINDAFDDSDKYNFLVTQSIPNAGGVGAGNDVATFNGVTINQLDPYTDEFVNVVYGVSNSQVELETLFTTANDKLNEFLLKPRVLETFSVCAGSSLTIDPTDGDTFEFYEDPLAQDLITTGTSFTPATITKDTVFYAKNLDNTYPSDIFQISVKLFNEIAEFTMSTDTLYLDNPTTNVVQFTDQSLDAISWNWDFDQGTSSNIQNPALSFTNTGTYTITLEVMNALGCVDTFSRDLVVANRPSAPNLSEVTICPGEEVVLNDPTAEKLHVYTLESSTEPVLSGFNLTLESILHDTTLYVSGVYGSFESAKVPISIDVLEVHGSIVHLPDTTSEDHRILLVANGIESGSTVIWTIDGNESGTSNQLSIPASAGTKDVSLEITSPSGCTITLNKEILISTSPFASQDDLVSCFDEQVRIRPENGTYFGFYEDVTLTTLIKKGEELVTNSYSQLYVVNLDDGLPGMPIEVNITNQTLEFEIEYTITDIGSNLKVDLSIATDDNILIYQWYINGILSETIPNATFFLESERYEIILAVTGASGCQSSDTLTLDLTPPLSVDKDPSLSIFPNPTAGIIQINSSEPVQEVQVFSLDGKKVTDLLAPKRNINLSQLNKGLYVVKIRIGNVIHERHLMINH